MAAPQSIATRRDIGRGKQRANSSDTRLAIVLPDCCHASVMPPTFMSRADLVKRSDGSTNTERGWRIVDLVAVFAALIALVALASVSWHGHVAAFDRTATGDIVQSKHSWGFVFAEGVSFVGSGVVVGALALALGGFVWLRTRHLLAALLTPVAAVAGGVLELSAKHLVARVRPSTAALTGQSGFGFPSGHTTGFTALAFGTCATLALVGLWPRRSRLVWWMAGVTSIVVGLARVAVGAHFLFDVVAGLLLGFVCARLTAHLLPVAYERLSPLVSRTVERRPTGRSLRK